MDGRRRGAERLANGDAPASGGGLRMAMRRRAGGGATTVGPSPVPRCQADSAGGCGLKTRGRPTDRRAQPPPKSPEMQDAIVLDSRRPRARRQGSACSSTCGASPRSADWDRGPMRAIDFVEILVKHTPECLTQLRARIARRLLVVSKLWVILAIPRCEVAFDLSREGSRCSRGSSSTARMRAAASSPRNRCRDRTRARISSQLPVTSSDPAPATRDYVPAAASDGVDQSGCAQSEKQPGRETRRG